MRVNSKIEIDGEMYKLLAKDPKYLLLEKKGEITEYIVMTGITVKEDQVQWKRAKFFVSREEAEQEIRDMTQPNLEQEDVSKELYLAKRMTMYPLERLVWMAGQTAITDTLAALISGKANMPIELKKWALTITGKQIKVNFLTTQKIIEIWKDAKEMHLFDYHVKEEKEIYE